MRRNKIGKMPKQEKNICERYGGDWYKCNMLVEVGTGGLLVILGGLLWLGTFSLSTVFGLVLILWGIKKLFCCRWK